MVDDDPMIEASASEPTGTERRAEAKPAAAATADWLERNLPLSLEAYERAALERALVEAWGDASHAARLLGIGRSTFYRKAGKHGINLGELRAPAARPEPTEAAEVRSDPIGVGPSKALG